ncbi:Major facilitator superfamily domain, general substrate transporter [Niveomyces insectorum RCEF 264]|uniref:Major facilitator superfamily domain, general substrate transporter n=1 Tax=Niveomyces insectorum RCEF 264 TaxID=1081102 RepID=A0A167XTI6_9HYPO|nr:Major facilitator superfamily domain, general substrate transporter [Niveomyces insectorum RCEF 264]
MKDDQTAAEKTLHDQTNILPRSQLIVALATVSLTLGITMMDQNGISVTLPTIARDLNAQNTISWAGTSSLIANTTFQMLYGRMSDIFGRKVVFISATVILALADLLCGLSQNAPMFYVFRGVAGIAGGGITNLAMIIVSDVVTLEQRGFYQGVLGSFVALGNVAGPFLAGAFIARASWRYFFFMLAPLGVVVAGVSYFLLPSKPRTASLKESASKIDYAGVLSSSIGVIFLLIPISGGGSYFTWTSPMVISMLVIGACSFIFFVVVEWKLARLPMMPVQIFRNPVLCVLMAQTFLFGSAYQSYLYYLPLFLQNARQYSILRSASITVAMVVVQSMFSILSGQYLSRRKRYGEVLWFGFGMWTIQTHVAVIVGLLVLIGAGVGCAFQPTLVALQAHSSKSRRAVVISTRNFFRCCGGAFGLAASAAVLQAALKSHLPPEYSYLANNTYSLPKVQGPGFDAVLDAYMAASRAVFILQIPLVGLCLVGCLFVKDNGLESPQDKATMLESMSQTPNNIPDTEKALSSSTITAEEPSLRGSLKGASSVPEQSELNAEGKV